MAYRQHQRVGLFGGAFDPPHQGHVALAQAAVVQLQLDRLHIVPTGFAWHKARALTDAKHRLAMCKLAFASVDCALVDPQETLRAGPSYTVDTLQSLKARYQEASFFLVLGEDQARTLWQWHRVDALLGSATICVARRLGASSLSTNPLNISAMCWLDMPPASVSATDIRSLASQHLPLTPLVCEAVAGYIADHHLYLSNR